jgi:hypothetical protein
MLATSKRSPEEFGYDIPDNEELERFTFVSFVRSCVQTMKIVHTFMKTLGAFGYTRASADITLEMLKDVMH